MVDFNWLTETFDLPVMRVLQGTESLYLDRLMLVLTHPLTWIPLYLAIACVILRNNKSLANACLVILFGLLAVGLASLLTDQVMKPGFMRFRPGRDMMLKYTIDVVDGYRGGPYGFVSAHASNTMACVVFVCLIVRNRLMTLTLLAWSLLKCYTRIYLGLHFPSDVLGGLLLGAASGLAVYGLYRLLRRKSEVRTEYISKNFTSTGYLHDDAYIVAVVFVLVIIYALFRAVFEM